MRRWLGPRYSLLSILSVLVPTSIFHHPPFLGGQPDVPIDIEWNHEKQDCSKNGGHSTCSFDKASFCDPRIGVEVEKKTERRFTRRQKAN